MEEHMAEEPADLVLEFPRAIRGDVADVRTTLREHGRRLNRIGLGIAGLRRDQAQEAEHGAHVEVDIGSLRDRLARIEARLDLQSV
jgi:hypothetical protein